MMYHSMGIDEMGHLHGSHSQEYARAIAGINDILADLLPVWSEAGFEVVVTADHGMNELGLHGGTELGQREVQLYIFSEKVNSGRYEEKHIHQDNIAPLLCSLLDLSAGKEMRKELEIEMRV